MPPLSGNDGYYTDNFETTPDNVKYAEKTKFELKVLVWLAISFKGMTYHVVQKWLMPTFISTNACRNWSNSPKGSILKTKLCFGWIWQAVILRKKHWIGTLNKKFHMYRRNTRRVQEGLRSSKQATIDQKNKAKIERNRPITLPEDSFERSLLASKNWRQRTIECNLNVLFHSLWINLNINQAFYQILFFLFKCRTFQFV